MKFNEVREVVKGIPFISERNAKQLYDFIIENKLRNCLELGFAHGVASCCIAAALDELGGGNLVAVDLVGTEKVFQPSINELLEKLGLKEYVTVQRENTGYNWFLHNEIVRCTDADNVCKPQYDLCIIDGPKNWTIDGHAFFCADKLLKSDGWIIFDDYNWKYANADKSRTATDGITHRELSEEERNAPHIKEVFHLLVMQHPSYSNFIIQEEGDWAWAQKKKGDAKKVSYVYATSMKDILKKNFVQLQKKMKAKL